jgi:hypothetical protein
MFFNAYLRSLRQPRRPYGARPCSHSRISGGVFSAASAGEVPSIGHCLPALARLGSIALTAHSSLS